VSSALNDLEAPPSAVAKVEAPTLAAAMTRPTLAVVTGK
jgi:hypothetical protein